MSSIKYPVSFDQWSNLRAQAINKNKQLAFPHMNTDIMPAAQHPSKSDYMAPRQNPLDEVIQPPHLGVQRVGVNSTASSRRPSGLAQSIDGPCFRDVDWTKRRRAEAGHPERFTNLGTAHERQKLKNFVKELCLPRVKASIGRRRKRIKGGIDAGASSSDAQPQRGPQPAISEEYSTLTWNGQYGMQMQTQTGVTTTDSNYSSLDYREYSSETDYDDSTSSDDGTSDCIGSDLYDADRASAVYLNSEYARTDEINDAFGDGRYVLSPNGSLVARSDLGPLHALHARAAPKMRAWWRAVIGEGFSSGRPGRKAEAVAIGRVGDGANGMARVIKRMLEKAGAKLAPVLTRNESGEDEPAVEVRIHEIAEGAREYKRRVLARGCMHYQVSERRNTI